MDCPPNHVVNPRTGRCVREDRPLGRAVAAATKAARQGLLPPACPKQQQEYDFAVRKCVSEPKSRVLALRAIRRRAEPAIVANASLTAKNLTSRIFAKVKNRNAKNMHAEASDIMGGAMARISQLKAELDACRAREAQLQAALLRAYNDPRTL